MLAALARARQSVELAELTGSGALSETDRSYIAYRSHVEQQLLHQGTDELRSFDDTISRAWAALATLPRQELTMVSTAFLDRYLPEKAGQP